MFWTLALAVALSGAASEPIVHDVTVEHRGTSVAARYHGEITLATRQRGMAAPMRASSEQCDWTATLNVDRQFSDAGTASRPVTREAVAKGTLAGNCRALGKQIAREVAARRGDLQNRLVAIAEADRPKLLAELELIGKYAAND